MGKRIVFALLMMMISVGFSSGSWAEDTVGNESKPRTVKKIKKKTLKKEVNNDAADNSADTEFSNYIDKYLELYENYVKVDALQHSATRECCNPSDPERIGCSGVPKWENDRCKSVGTARAMQIYGYSTDDSRKRVERIESTIQELMNSEKISTSAHKRAKRMLNAANMCFSSNFAITLCEK